jgi:3-oxoadipate enol-lactonase / 4-carboxymuconolactone decarboxylase
VTVEVHYEESGRPDAPALLLSNSLGTDLSMWDPQLPVLAEHFRVIRYDTRGHGRSPAPPGPYTLADLGGDALALLDKLGLSRVHFCGLSLGGMTGMWLAANAPERIDRLVLCATSALLGPPEFWQERIDAVLAGGTASLADAIVGRWLTPGFRTAHPDVEAKVRAMVLDTPGPGYAGCCAAIQSMDLLPVLPGVRARTLVIAGSADPATPPEHGARIAAAIPGARLLVLDDVAHLLNLQQPAAVTEVVRAHLTAADPYQDGMATRRQVLGDEHVDRAVANTTGLTADFQRYLTSTAWGQVWSRPGLDRRTRSAATLAVLTALRATDELAMHLRAALRNGLSPAEIAEVLLHTAVYAGVPAANTAFRIAAEVLSETPPDTP